MRLFSKASRQAAIALAISFLVPAFCLPALAEGEEFGPPNMLKTFPTPFTRGSQQTGSANDDPVTQPISISGRRTLASRLRLADRLVPPRLYLPGRMILGRSEEFIIKGKPGAWAAIAMADKNSGAKDIAGHKIRLGADRKLVSLIRIGEGGIGQMFVETPVQGDMIGQNFYFEAVVWSKDDFSDAEVCQTISPEQTEGADNGVLVAAENEVKKGVKFGTTTALPPSQHSIPGSLDSNKP
jgi:hypothetical protein